MQTETPRSTRLAEIAVQLSDAKRFHVQPIGDMEDGIRALDAHHQDGRVYHVWVDDTDVIVTEWNSARTKIEMSEARFRGVDAYTIGRYVQALAS